MNRQILQSPLVGAHFRPPAKQILASAPSGAILSLVLENDNPYDDQAIKVLINVTEQIPQAQLPVLDEALAGTGTDLEDLMAEPTHVGYVISQNNKKLGAWSSNWAVRQMLMLGPCQASLGFAPDGTPLVITRLTEQGD